MNNQGLRILIVDDEENIQDFMSYNLKKEGYEVATASNGKEGLKKIESFQPNLVLLDIMMPIMDGIETMREIRANSKTKDTLVAFLTARGEDYSQVAGFEAGADDYITKTVTPRVLISRIKGLLRRTEEQDQNKLLEVGDLKIDKEQFLVWKKGAELIFPRKEFELLYLLASKTGKVFKREEILSKVWGADVIVGDRTIDVHVRKLREKLGDKSIVTVKGVGYKLEV